MSARSRSDAAAPPAALAAPPERRQTARHDTALAVTLRTRSVKGGTAELLDLSREGCRVRTGEYLATGGFVMVTIGSFSAFDAVVMWAADGEAGLRFARPLHDAILAHLVALGIAAG